MLGFPSVVLDHHRHKTDQGPVRKGHSGLELHEPLYLIEYLCCLFLLQRQKRVYGSAFSRVPHDLEHEAHPHPAAQQLLSQRKKGCSTALLGAEETLGGRMGFLEEARALSYVKA